jgi:carboxylesterase
MDRGREQAARLVREFAAQISESATPAPFPETPITRRLMPGGEPFLFRGGRVGCLLVHGFTATPQEMRGLGESLAGQGHTVLGIRLAGHATSMDDLLRVDWTDWQADVEGGLQILRSLCDRIVLVGLSLGGALALLQGAAGSVAGVAALSTPFALPTSPRMRLRRGLRGIWRFAAKGPSDFRDPEAARGRVAYPAYPVAVIAEVDATLQAMRRCLPRVRVPVLLMHARDETFIPPESLSAIEVALGGAKVTSMLVEGSNHILTCDAQRSLVWRAVSDFVERCTGGPA